MNFFFSKNAMFRIKISADKAPNANEDNVLEFE